MNIRRIRESIGMSAATLADKVGVTQAYISMLETGERKNPSLEVMLAIANQLHCSLQDLVDTSQGKPTTKASL